MAYMHVAALHYTPNRPSTLYADTKLLLLLELQSIFFELRFSPPVDLALHVTLFHLGHGDVLGAGWNEISVPGRRVLFTQPVLPVDLPFLGQLVIDLLINGDETAIGADNQHQALKSKIILKI